MSTHLLTRLIEHNNWANRQLIRACAGLPDDQLDALPMPQEPWTIRKILIHLVAAQQGYLNLLTLAPEARSSFEERERTATRDLEAMADASGAGLLAWALDEEAVGDADADWVEASDGYRFAPWVVLVQAVHHGNDHRSQICDILRALGIEPPELSGWDYGEAMDAVAPPEG